MNTNNPATLEQSVPVAMTKNLQLIASAALGLIVLFGVGFTPMGIAHNAAHDTRYSVALPCH